MGTNKSQNFRINVYGDTAQFIGSTEGFCYLDDLGHLGPRPLYPSPALPQASFRLCMGVYIVLLVS